MWLSSQSHGGQREHLGGGVQDPLRPSRMQVRCRRAQDVWLSLVALPLASEEARPPGRLRGTQSRAAALGRAAEPGPEPLQSLFSNIAIGPANI